MNDKIRTQHLERKAILYVRQSSLQQVTHHEESRKLQYAMEARLRELGWKVVDIVDEDLGRSAAGTAERRGFERMVAEVCLGGVGAVAAREVSRFARNSREWQQLIEVCKMVDTLLVDQEAVYDSRRGNDRLLLGLKGSMNEYELDILRLRAWEARLAKARRGELRLTLPAGYVRTEDDGIEKDPNARVRESIELIFRKFMELGTVRQTLLWFLEERLELPSINFDGRRWVVVWRRPKYSMLLEVLKNPLYAGAYAYGRTGSERSYRDGRPRQRIRRRSIDQWHVLLYDHHAGYVDRAGFERIQAMIAQNNRASFQTAAGAAKKGPALLSGLLRCRRCGLKLMTTYTGRERNVCRYVCFRGSTDNGEPRCINFGGFPLEQAIGREAARVVAPGAVEAARSLEARATQQNDDVLSSLTLELKEARYAADRVRRQFDGVEPENRLVADELERRWNAALARVAELERRLHAENAKRAVESTSSRQNVGELAADMDRVWDDERADVRLKKRILRTLIEEVVVDVDRGAGTVAAVVHWKGGVHTEMQVACRRRGKNSLHTAPEAVEAVRSLALICSDEQIAGHLNRNGLRTGHGNRWSAERVRGARLKHGIPVAPSPRNGEPKDWLTLSEAGVLLGVASSTLRHALERRVIPALHPLEDGPWILKRVDIDAPVIRQEMDRVRRTTTGAVQDSDQQNLFDQAARPDEAV